MKKHKKSPRIEGLELLSQVKVYEAAQMKRLRKIEREVANRQPTKHASAKKIAFPHWWKDPAFVLRLTENKIRLEEQKAAMWYEAARRCTKVQEAFREGKIEQGWQDFTELVVRLLPNSWPELDKTTQDNLIQASYSPLAVPPKGYSTFPPEEDKPKQREVSMQVLALPKTDDSEAAVSYVKWARRFIDAGFTIVAIDKKTAKSEQRAFEAVKALPRTFRKADVKWLLFHKLPPDITEAEVQRLKAKEQQGKLTGREMDELWAEHIEPSQSPHGGWIQTATVEQRVFHKRKRERELIEEMQFNFEAICRQLESFDKGRFSEFVNAIRL